ncbi:MAG: type IX secretion system sortase PorU [Muribaculaceae bacterium]|nr:type IX secretion system sortase PorU [Muribaculaceae bacterium]
MVKIINRQLAVLAVFTLLAFAAGAYPTSNYATTSQLATGHWVKIAIPADGIYQLTIAELSAMGFPDINRVKIYGYGGHMLNEPFTGTEHNDIEQIPTLIFRDKLCFYANGPLEMTFDVSDNNPYFLRRVNAYSTHGYYFVTEGDGPRRIRNFEWSTGTSTHNYRTSYNWFLHERELTSLTNMGKDLLGESLMDESCYINYEMPNISSNKVMLQTNLAVESSSTSTGSDYYSLMSVSILSNGSIVPVNYSSTIIKPTTGAHYTVANARASVTLPSLEETGQVKVDKVVTQPAGSSVVTVKTCNLDYLLLSYEQKNSLMGAEYNQQKLYIPQILIGDTIAVEKASSSVVLWNLDGPYPIGLASKNADGGTVLFSSPLSQNAASFVAFDPTMELRSISGYEEVANQNIHAMQTPDFIIVTNSDYIEAAEALATLHHNHEGMDVLVVSQDEVFNEFSSGTPDAMAVRLMCKMFYDRNPQKLKYLLMMGQGTFDNRKLVSNKPGTVITYETDDSNSESTCYASDDVFGILDDGSGRKFSSEYIRLGVGRLTPENITEALNDVKKIAKYISEPDYGPWRNNALMMADQGDSDLHIFQTQRICDIIEDEHDVKLEQNKAFIPFFAKAVGEDMLVEESRSSPEAKRYVASALSSGQYFSTYVGHASPTVFTGHSKLWTLNDVNTVNYPHIPIMTTACCDVARFDDVKRGIAERMVHKLDGGAIAMLTATREVEARQNDRLNQAFVNAFFTLDDNGTMPTMGHAVMKSKQSFTNDNKNKMMFVFLGDPAMKINYPLNRFKFNKVNGTTIVDDLTEVSVSPMHYVDIDASVMNSDGSNVDASFNGKAYITLYDSQRFFKNTGGKYNEVPYRDIYYPRAQLSQIDAEVKNGQLKTRILVPRDLQANGKLRISLYAHKTGSEEMVNGRFDNLAVADFDESTAVTDNQAPVITAMYFDEPNKFAETATTTPGGILNISVTDETALSMTSSITGDMKLVLDNGSQTYYLVKDYARISDGGKRIDISMPINDLTPGRHSLYYLVCDVAGNFVTKTIDFVVEQPTNIELAVSEVAATQKATFYVAKNALAELPELTIKVTDVVGNIVWQNTTSSFPYEWNLTGLDGTRVANGVYRFWATYDDDTYYGGTPKSDLIVIAP